MENTLSQLENYSSILSRSIEQASDPQNRSNFFISLQTTLPRMIRCLKEFISNTQTFNHILNLNLSQISLELSNQENVPFF